MNNNIFHPNRFFNLLARSLKSNPKSWLFTIAIFAGLPIIFLILNLTELGFNVRLNDRVAFLQLFMTAAFVFSPFVLFFNYNHPKKGLTEVMLPASTLEKYIVMQLSCILLAPLTTLVLFGGMDSLFSLLFPNAYTGGHAIPIALSDFFSSESLPKNFVTQQAILFCNLLFVKRKVLKTAGTFILAMIVFLTITGIIIGVLGYQNSFADTKNISLNFGSRGFFEIHINDHPLIITMQVARILVQGVLPVVLAIGSYFVMKNKRY